MRRMQPMVWGTALALAALARPAAADTTYHYSGDACHPANGDAAKVWHSSEGTSHGNTGTYLWFYCPVTGNQSDTVLVTNAEVRYRDSDSATSLKCQPWLRSSTGSVMVSPFLYSCGLAKGCAGARGQCLRRQRPLDLGRDRRSHGSQR
jgi:hypothetical protein